MANATTPRHLRVHTVVVTPCPHGYAITCFGAAPLRVSPTYHESWLMDDIRASLSILYPNATVKYRDYFTTTNSKADGDA